jgi:hypothetical protein
MVVKRVSDRNESHDGSQTHAGAGCGREKGTYASGYCRAKVSKELEELFETGGHRDLSRCLSCSA